MFRNLLVILAGGLLLANPLTAQGCCDKGKAGCDDVAKAECSDKADDCAGGSCSASGTVASTATQDEPSTLAKGLAGLATKSYEFDFAVNAKMGPGGGNAKGHFAFGNPMHFSVKLSAEMGMGEETQEMGLNLVADGTYLYFHVDADDAQIEYGKVELALVKDLIAKGASESPVPVFDAKGALNASSIDKAISMSGMKVVKDAEKGTLTLSMAKPVAEGEEGPGESVNITLNAKTYFPMSITAVQGKEGTIKADFSNIKIQKNLAAFGENAFKFVVPEGIVVMDLTQMIKMSMPADAGSEEEELEF